MKAVIQRIRRACLIADGRPHAAVGPGMLILLGVEQADGEADADVLADKCQKIRIFEDENGKINLSPVQAGAEALVISNFTLCGDCTGGNRPFFGGAARPEQAEPLYERFVQTLRQTLPVKTGRFGADMQTETVLDGPVTILLNSKTLKKGK